MNEEADELQADRPALLEYRSGLEEKASRGRSIWRRIVSVMFYGIAIVLGMSGVIAAIVLVPIGYTMAGSARGWGDALLGGLVAVGGILSLLPAMFVLGWEDEPAWWARRRRR